MATGEAAAPSAGWRCGPDELAVRAPRGVAYEANLPGAPGGRATGRAGRPPRQFGRVRGLEGVEATSAELVPRAQPDLRLHRGSAAAAVCPRQRWHVDPNRTRQVEVGL